MPVAESRQLPVDRPLESIVCGQPVVLFRRADGRPTCLDAHCPHLGANLAHGGRVVRHAGENCIRCPFHGWRFAPDGACVAVPYTENQGASPILISSQRSRSIGIRCHLLFHKFDLSI